MKENGEPIVMVTAYDYPSATVAEAAGVDLVLVGDSAANVVLGYDRTDLVSMEEMIVLGKAVRRGLRTPLMIADMPMGSYEASDELAVLSAQRLIKETGCQTVKLEAGGVSAQRARAIVAAGIPVMGHLGLTPQTATALGGYKAQGKSAKAAIQMYEDAFALQEAGCFAVVFEAVPAEIATMIAERLDIVTIGIGAGSGTSGQVLVFHDLLGITTGHMAKFVKQYADVHAEMVDRGRPLRRRGARRLVPRPRARLRDRRGGARRIPPPRRRPRPSPRPRRGSGSRWAASRSGPAAGVGAQRRPGPRRAEVDLAEAGQLHRQIAGPARRAGRFAPQGGAAAEGGGAGVTDHSRGSGG